MKNHIFLLCVFGLTHTLLSAQISQIHKADLNAYTRAMELYEKEKYSTAMDQFSRFLEKQEGVLSEETTRAAWYKARCALELFHPDAEYEMNAFILQHPESPLILEAYLVMGDYFFQRDSYRKAITYYEKVDRLELTDEQLAAFYFRFGYSHFMKGDKDMAMLYFSEIKDIDTEYSAPAQYYFSHIAYERKLYESALDGFMRLREDETFAPVVPFYIVQILYTRKDYDGILEIAPPLLEVASEARAPEIYRFIGDAHYQKGQYAEAIDNLEEYAAAARQMSREGEYQLGFCYYQTHLYEKAIPHFEKVTRQRDELSQNAYYLLGDCHLHLDDKNKARVAFQSASRLSYDAEIKEDAQFLYAKILFETSYSPFGEVIAVFNEYIETYPGSDHLHEAYDYLVAAYAQTRNYKAALASLDRITDKDDRLKSACQRVAFYRGLELFANLDYSGATDLFDKSLEYAVYDLEVRARTIYWKAEAFYRLGEYERAADLFEEFINLPGSRSLNEYWMAYYGKGYADFNQKDYASSLSWFSRYEKNAETRGSKLMADVYNRMADGYFIQTQYPQAMEYYQKAIDAGKADVDYALFQKGFTSGLLKDQQGKVQVLTSLLQQFPESNYYDDALFERGRARVMLNQSEEAATDFRQIIADFENSSYRPKAMVQLGLVLYNRNNISEAIVAYKEAIENYPNAPEAQNALTGLKNIYVETNDVETYFAYVRSLDGYSDVSLSERDSLTYVSGENLYLAGNCERATQVFDKYIEDYPEGAFLLNAHFYRAECASLSGDMDKALESYQYVLRQPFSPFLEPSVRAAADMLYSRADYAAAVPLYEKLEAIAELPSNILLAKVGIMRCHYQLAEYEGAVKAAEAVLASDKLSEELAREATFKMAKSWYATNQYSKALDEFKKGAFEVKSIEGAESKYRVAEILFLLDQPDLAEKEINAFIDLNTPHPYWMAKVFILLSRVHMSRDDDFTARHTLQSLIDYYGNEDDGILEEARQLLQSLNPALQDTLPGKPDTVRMQMDTTQIKNIEEIRL